MGTASLIRIIGILTCALAGGFIGQVIYDLEYPSYIKALLFTPICIAVAFVIVTIASRIASKYES
jgi:hypothetical protein